MHKGILIFGVSALTKGALDIFHKNEMLVYAILDDDPKWHHAEIEGIPVLGPTDDINFLNLLKQGESAAFIAYGNGAKRTQLWEMLTTKYHGSILSAIHPSAVIADGRGLGQGNYIGPQVCLAPGVSVGDGCVLHSGSIIEAETHIHNHVTIGAGSLIGAQVIIEYGVSLGMGAKVLPGLSIQQGTTIEAGMVVATHIRAAQ